MENSNNKLLHLNRLRNHVITQLTDLGYQIKRNGTEIPILCPYHDDSHPSLDVHIGDKITPGGFKCWSCGAHGSFNHLSSKLNLTPFVYDNSVFDANRTKPNTNPTEDDDPYKELSRSLKNISLFGEKGLHYLPGTEQLPLDFSWRGVPREVYSNIGGKFYWDRKLELDYLYLPISMNKKYVGYTICALQPAKLKYMTFADTSKTFLLYDQVPSVSTIVITEGHFDAIRLFHVGIPSVCIFGVQNWGPIKKAAILAKAPKKVIICMDSDNAGRSAANVLFEDLNNCVETVIYQIPEDENKYDPGNMPEYMIEHLRLQL